MAVKRRGTTSLPILETAGGHVVKESLVILQYLDDVYPERKIAQQDPCRRAVDEEFGWAETVFTPFFVRFWCLEYCEDFQLPVDERYDRGRMNTVQPIRNWACATRPKPDPSLRAYRRY